MHFTCRMKEKQFRLRNTHTLTQRGQALLSRFKKKMENGSHRGFRFFVWLEGFN